jgi:cytochrome c peroxidase
MAAVGVRSALVCGLLLACDPALDPVPAPALAPGIDGTHELLPLPETVDGLDPEKVKLGHLLFEEPLLSANSKVRCTVCHPLREAGMDGKKHSIGVKGQVWWNTPTIYNLAFSYRFNWRGQFRTLEDELDAPMLKNAMGNKSWDEVVDRLKKAEYEDRFRRAGFDGVTEAAIKKALASYERSLVTPNSRFDRYLRGDENALGAEEKAGLQRFKELGCVQCHQGRNVGGNMLQRIGAVLDYLSTRKFPIQEAEKARDVEDPTHLRLRVPSLRNVACTAPYLHDGEVMTLEEAIQIMGKHQVGRKLEADDVRQIKAFLITLTGQLPDGTPVCEEH